jgi:glycine/D-amino acid oxidase-like deaminating enzyme
VKTVAIIGAGLAGLAAAFHLSQHFKVSVFDEHGLGKGATGASTGLLHPYPGEQGRRSWKADEGMAATVRLLAIAEEEMGVSVAKRNGIIKTGECIGAEEDVEQLEDGRFLIHSGITVFVPLYVEGLWRACEKNQATLHLQEIKNLDELAEFDYTVVAAGYGIRNFPQSSHLKINFVKGQALACHLEEPLERSITGKQYTALTENPKVCYVGATYERYFMSEHPSLETALHLLKPSLPVLGVKSGMRVTNPAHYFPIMEKWDERTWCITALGSRGLLYHAYLAERLTMECLQCKELSYCF